MAFIYKAKAAVVKVAVGPATGNRIARIIRQGSVIPDGVDPAKLEQLVELGHIEKIEIGEDGTAQDEVAAAAAAEAAAKLAEDAKAKADEEAKVKAAAAAKEKADADAKAAAAAKTPAAK